MALAASVARMYFSLGVSIEPVRLTPFVDAVDTPAVRRVGALSDAFSFSATMLAFPSKSSCNASAVVFEHVGKDCSSALRASMRVRVLSASSAIDSGN